jgi:GYF domain 2
VSDDWYYLSSHGHVGPLSLEELKETLASFQNGQDVPVWREGFANWRKAGDVPEIDAETPLPPPIGTGRDGAADPKLPLWNTICLSYSSYFRNFPDVLRISWLWLAVVAPLMGIMSRLQLSWVAGVQADMKGGMPPQQMLASKPVETMVLGTIAILVFAFAGVSIAVAWHRRIILRELPGFSGSNVATKGLWRYVWMGFAIGLIVFLPLLVIVLSMSLLLSPVAKAGTPWSLIPIPMIFLLWLAGLAVTLRLSLLLPARAVGDLDLTFKRSGSVQAEILGGFFGASWPARYRRCWPCSYLCRSFHLAFLLLAMARLTATRQSAWPPSARFSSPLICSLSQSGSALCPTPTRISSSGRNCNLHSQLYR